MSERYTKGTFKGCTPAQAMSVCLTQQGVSWHPDRAQEVCAAIFAVLTESQQDRVLRSLGWETAKRGPGLIVWDGQEARGTAGVALPAEPPREGPTPDVLMMALQDSATDTSNSKPCARSRTRGVQVVGGGDRHE